MRARVMLIREKKREITKTDFLDWPVLTVRTESTIQTTWKIIYQSTEAKKGSFKTEKRRKHSNDRESSWISTVQKRPQRNLYLFD